MSPTLVTQDDSQPVFSVVVPAYNVSSYLDECVQSVSKQSFGSFELIIVDDGSTDGTSSIADELSAEDVRIRVLHCNNGGLSRARNIGLEASTGNYVLFLDGDDELEEDALLTLSKMVESNPAVDIVCFNYAEVVGDTGRTLQVPDFPSLSESGPSEFLSYVNRGDLGNYAWSRIYRRGFLLGQETCFDETLIFLEDVEFTSRVCSKAKLFMYCPNQLYRYRRHRLSMCCSPNPARALVGLEVIKRRVERGCAANERDAMLNGALGTLFMCYDISGRGSDKLAREARESIKKEIKYLAKQIRIMSNMNKLKIALLDIGLYWTARDVKNHFDNYRRRMDVD